MTSIRLLRTTRGNRKMLITPQEKECSSLLVLMSPKTINNILM